MSDRQVGLRDRPFNRQESQHSESCERDAGGALSHINFKCITFVYSAVKTRRLIAVWVRRSARQRA